MACINLALAVVFIWLIRYECPSPVFPRSANCENPICEQDATGRAHFHLLPLRE